MKKKRKKRTQSKNIRWDLRPASPDSAIFDFVNRKVGLNQNDDIIKWSTTIKEMRAAYKAYFETFKSVCLDIRFVSVTDFNRLLHRLGLKKAPKYLTLLDPVTKKYLTKQYRCWVGCRLVG